LRNIPAGADSAWWWSLLIVARRREVFFNDSEVSMFLSSGQKRTAKSIAKDSWNLVNREHKNKPLEERKRIAIEQVEEDLFHMRRGRLLGSKKGFGSVLTSIIISLMVRLALKWIERWAEMKLLEVLDER
jgi:hypothetical protein